MSGRKLSKFNAGDTVTLNKGYRRRRGEPREVPAGSTGIVKKETMGYLEIDIDGVDLLVFPHDVTAEKGMLDRYPEQEEVLGWYGPHSWWKGSVGFKPYPSNDEQITVVAESLTSVAASLSEIVGAEDLANEIQEIIGEIQNLQSVPVEAKKSIVMDMPDRGPGLDNILFNLGQAASKLESVPRSIDIVNRIRELVPRVKKALEGFGKNSWWKRADPTIDDSGYMQFQQGEENWFHDDFRVGDTVMLLDTGEQGEITENYGESYLVHTDSGEQREVEVTNLQPVDAEPKEEPSYDDLKRFEGDDPEEQNWEDPTYSTGVYIDDDVSELQSGDKVRILFTENEDDMDLVNAMGTVVSGSGDSYVVDVDGESLNFGRDAIELMPTDHNPHYGQGKSSGLWWKTSADPERVKRLQEGKQYDKNITLPYLQEHWSQEEMVNNVLSIYEESDEQQRYAGVQWYNDVHELAKEFSEKYSQYTFEQMCAVFAVLSPNVYWDVNYIQAIKFIEEHAHGADDWIDIRIWTPYSYVGKPAGYPRNNDKAWEILDTGDTGLISEEDSKKVHSFYHNFLMGPDDPDTKATVDIWATRVLFLDPFIKPKIALDGSYDYLERPYQTAGEMMGLTPKEMQAVTWITYKQKFGKNKGDLSYVDRFNEHIQTPYTERSDPKKEDLSLRPKKKHVLEEDYTVDEESKERYRKERLKDRADRMRTDEKKTYDEYLKQLRREEREEKKRQKQKGGSWWKDASIFTDPDLDFDEPPKKKDPEEEYQNRVMRQMETQERGDLNRAIMEAGGIQTSDTLREEYQAIPDTFKRRDGLSGDVMADYLFNHHPELGIETEDDLIQYFADRYRFSKRVSWWKESDIPSDEYSYDNARRYDEEENNPDREEVGWIYEDPEPSYAVENVEEAYEWGLESAEEFDPTHPSIDDFPSQEIYDSYLEGFLDGSRELAISEFPTEDDVMLDVEETPDWISDIKEENNPSMDFETEQALNDLIYRDRGWDKDEETGFITRHNPDIPNNLEYEMSDDWFIYATDPETGDRYGISTEIWPEWEMVSEEAFQSSENPTEEFMLPFAKKNWNSLDWEYLVSDEEFERQLEIDHLNDLFKNSRRRSHKWWKRATDLTEDQFRSMMGDPMKPAPQSQGLASGMMVRHVSRPDQTGKVLTKTPQGKYWVDWDDGTSGSYDEHELEIADELENLYRRSRKRSKLNSWWKGSSGLWREFEDEDEENEFMEEWKNKRRDAYSLGIELFNRGYSEDEVEEFLNNQLGNGFGMHQFDAAYNGYMETWKASDPMNQEYRSQQDDPLENLYRNSNKRSWWDGF